ncbi:MAG: DUF2802 domain-containing protein [Thermodesulfobacteriota bacterium]
MDSSILLAVDVLLTASILYLLFLIKGQSRAAAPVDKKALHEAEMTLRSSIEGLNGREKDLSLRQERLKDIIARLDEALADIQTAPSSDADDEGAYSAARNLLKTGEPIENVVKICNLTKGEADVLSSITAMAS